MERKKCTVTFQDIILQTLLRRSINEDNYRNLVSSIQVQFDGYLTFHEVLSYSFPLRSLEQGAEIFICIFYMFFLFQILTFKYAF